MRSLIGALSLGVALSACASTRSPVSTGPTPPSPPAVPPSRTYTRGEAAAAIDSLVRQPDFRTANWGVLVVNPRTGDTLYAHDAEKLFVPASNTKIVTGASSLLLLGPDFTWKTHLATRGELRDSVLHGDLVVTGRGDPTVSSRLSGDAMEPLRAIADSLLTRGIRRIAGRIVRGNNSFTDSRWGAGWQWDYLDAGYAAGVDDLFFNEGTVRIAVRGAGMPGFPVQVSTSPASTYPPVRIEAVTLPAGDNGSRPRIRLEVDSISGDVFVRGAIAAGDSTTQTLTLRDPATAYLFALREALIQRGIVVDSTVSAVARASRDGRADTLLTVQSAPLRDVLGEMMKPSQNQLAEIFLKTIGLELTGVGSADSGMRRVREQLLAWGAREDGFALRDGSGLTRNNFISPESIVHVLASMRNDPLFPVFFEALPVAGVDGTLRSRMRGTPAEDNVRGKTGTLARASALSGYVATLDGENLVFSLLCNNFTTPANAVTGMQNRIAIMLASLEWNR